MANNNKNTIEEQIQKYMMDESISPHQAFVKVIEDNEISISELEENKFRITAPSIRSGGRRALNPYEVASEVVGQLSSIMNGGIDNMSSGISEWSILRNTITITVELADIKNFLSEIAKSQKEKACNIPEL